MSNKAPPEKIDFVLFISPGCKFSNNFISKLRTKPDLLKKFNFVNIDTLQMIPDEVDEIPCVYDGKSVYQGEAAFKWLNEKMSEFLDAANDGLSYSFLEGQEEQVFSNYSLLDQKNGSFGMDSNVNPQDKGDPTRMVVINDNTNKNRTLDSIMASRTTDEQQFAPKK